MNKKTISFLLLVVVAAFFIIEFVYPGSVAHQTPESMPQLSIQTPTGTTTLFVHIADTPAKQTKGLGDRPSLPENEGMLFVFPGADYHMIWMKDMHFAIDIIWLDQYFTIIDIKEHATPDSYPEIFSPKEKDYYVLEVNDGFVARNGLTLGSHFEQK